MDIPDIAKLTLEGFFGLLVIIMFFDVATACVIALTATPRTFSAAFLMNYLRTHVLMRVYLIFSLAVIGHGIPPIGIPPIGAAADAAVISLGLYVVETLGSLRANLSGGGASAP